MWTLPLIAPSYGTTKEKRRRKNERCGLALYRKPATSKKQYLFSSAYRIEKKRGWLIESSRKKKIKNCSCEMCVQENNAHKLFLTPSSNTFFVLIPFDLLSPSFSFLFLQFCHPPLCAGAFPPPKPSVVCHTCTALPVSSHFHNTHNTHTRHGSARRATLQLRATLLSHPLIHLACSPSPAVVITIISSKAFIY